MMADWTRNLSLHFAPGGGSARIGWSRTGERAAAAVRGVGTTDGQPRASGGGKPKGRKRRTGDLDRLAGLNAARVGPDAVLPAGRDGRSGQHTLLLLSVEAGPSQPSAVPSEPPCKASAPL